MSYNDSHPIFVEGGPSTLPGTVDASNDGEGGSAHFTFDLPTDLRISQTGGSPDQHLHVIDRLRTFVVETYGAKIDKSAQAIHVTASSAIKNDVRGSGVFTTTGACEWHGTRAYGGSAIGGLIRRDELATGIFHALALQIPQQGMNKHSPNGHGWVWPATCADGGYETSYGDTGNVFMGSLLAIPPDADLSDVKSAPVKRIAEALRDFGAYVVDRGADVTSTFGSGIGIYVEPFEVPEAQKISYGDLTPIWAKLKVVANSGPASVGGGGKPRACYAPAAAE